MSSWAGWFTYSGHIHEVVTCQP